MTKKDFIEIADAIRGTVFADDEISINRLCAVMEKSNPKFKRDRWLAYLRGEVGPNGGTAK